MSKKPFNKLILDVINKGLESLGESPKQAIWVFLEKEFKVSNRELPVNIRAFQEGLQKIFGVGYNFLDSLFCQYLKEDTGKKFKNCKDFVECVESLQREVSVASCQKCNHILETT